MWSAPPKTDRGVTNETWNRLTDEPGSVFVFAVAARFPATVPNPERGVITDYTQHAAPFLGVNPFSSLPGAAPVGLLTVLAAPAH